MQSHSAQPPLQIGYCTNVHAGNDLATTQANLRQHALAVKERFAPQAPMGVGLWLSAATARDLQSGNQLDQFSDWLAEHGLVPFTLNGFPYGDFHQQRVKHRVYQPTWMQPERLQYTLALIDILDRLLPAGMQGSISTLPLGWGTPALSKAQLDAAALHLLRVADRLQRLHSDTGREICLAIEPEPGCALQRSEQVVRFFEEHLLPTGDENTVRRHLGVCHDVCHAAVMFESQQDVLERYRAAGLRVGKVQVSSAVCVDFAALGKERRADAVSQLAGFAEDRYLHQTCVRETPNGAPRFYEDLPLALAQVSDAAALESQWCVHFHVPVYLEQFDLLGTSRDDVLECLQAVRQASEVTHFEVETYAWSVLPGPLQQPTLAEGIAAELSWFAAVIQKRGTNASSIG